MPTTENNLMDLVDFDTAGQRMFDLAARLYPICRSITGDGVRRTLSILGEYLPLETVEVPSGTEVFDWTVPREWNVSEAWIKGPDGGTVVDFGDHNLHLLNYSVPIHKTMPLAELKPHLFSLEDQPDLIPYRTSYYQDNWGFCLRHRDLERLADGDYEVCIKSTLEPGNLTYGELIVPGRTNDEVLISSHVCHPSLANDNLSGIAVATLMAETLLKIHPRYSYRFLFAPGTIGAITWLAGNQAMARRIKHGLVLSCLGDPGPLSYKRSRRGNTQIDRIAEHVLRQMSDNSRLSDFIPYGYDERQFCSPGFNLAVGALSRTPWGQFPEYHTSADNLDFIKPEYLSDSLQACMRIVSCLERNRTYMSLNPECEPQLGKRGLYDALGGGKHAAEQRMAMLWVLSFADGNHSLLDIAERSRIAFDIIADVAAVLESHQLLTAS